MFTGIITDLGAVRRVDAAVTTRIEIATAYDMSNVVLGASIACAGVCLTVVERTDDSFIVDVSNETLARTTIGEWRPGRRINLERPLKVGDELGGHFVTGHVDATAQISGRHPDGDSVRLSVALPPELADYAAPKGSIAIDGVSLTVNEASRTVFGVNLIPHTLAVTSLETLQPGDFVNLEIDPLARYAVRALRSISANTP